MSSCADPTTAPDLAELAELVRGGDDACALAVEPPVEHADLRRDLDRAYVDARDVTAIRSGRPLPPEEYTASRLLGNGSRRALVAPRELWSLLDLGDTVVIENAELYSPGLARAVRVLERACGLRVGCNVFFTGPGFDGLPLHTDDTDAVVVQIAGAKHWTVHRAVTRSTRPRVFLGEPPGPVTLTARLRRGHGLVVPAGVPHRAVAAGDGSCHATFSFFRPSVEVVLTRLARRLADRDDAVVPRDYADPQRGVAWLATTLTALGADVALLRDALQDVTDDELGRRT